MIESSRFHRTGAAMRAALGMLAALAIGASSLLMVSPALANDGEAAPFAAPEVTVTGQDAVELNWEARGEAIASFDAYRVDVLAASGNDPLVSHRLGDAKDSRIVEASDGIADGRVGAKVTGLSAGTDYRFRIVALAGDGSELVGGEASKVARTEAAPAPPAEKPAERPATEKPAAGKPAEPADTGDENETKDQAAPGSPAGEDDRTDADADADADDDDGRKGSSDAAPEPGDGEGSASEGGYTPFDTLRLAPLSSTLMAPLDAGETGYPAPRVTVRGATAVEIDDADFRGSLVYPTIELEFQDEGGLVVRTVNASITGSVTVVSGLTPGTSYRVQAVLYEYDEDFNQAGSRRSELTPRFTTRDIVQAPGVIPAVPTIEPIDGSQLRASWAAVEDGGDVRTYTVRLYDEAGTLLQTKTGINPFTAGTQHIFTGLNSLTGYTATVQAIGYEIGTPQVNGEESEKSALAYTLKGVPGKPGTPTLAAGEAGTTDIVVSWAPPASDGGYPVTSYDLEFYSSASISTGGLIGKVRVPGDVTSWTYRDSAYVEVPIVAVVSANNHAGFSSRSGYSDTATAAKSPLKATAVPKSNLSNANSVSGIQLTDATSDGFTVTWTLPTGVNAPVSGTGYLIRLIEHLPTNSAGGTAYTYRPTSAPEHAGIGEVNAHGIVDLGTYSETTGRLSAALTGLDGGRTYRVSITPYVDTDDVRTYRISSSGSSASIATTGTGVPSAGGKPKAPTATGTDSLAWSGDALAEKFNAGSPITGYRVALYPSGGVEALQTVDATLDDDGAPSAEFTGLTRATRYQVAVAAVNANGVGQFSEPSDPVATLERPSPGSVAPPYATLAALRAGIKAGDVSTVSAKTAGVAGELESGTEIAPALPYSVAEQGEVWLFATGSAPAHQATFTADGAKAAAEWTLDDLATGEYVLLFIGDGGKLVAVTITVVKPVIGRTVLDDAVFRWGFNKESSNGAFFGGCNYFVAGKAPDVGSAQVFNQSRYSSQQGNVTIVKPNAAREYVQANWATKCLTSDGVPVTSSVTTATTEQQIVITGGSGWVDPSARSAEIQWEGDFTVVYYGGLTFWYASNPVLKVVDGVGTVTATLSGFGADMDDLSKWEPLEAREVTLAKLGGVKMTSKGFTVTPDYLGVPVTVAPGSSAQAVPQPAKNSDNAAFWGSFPQDFIDFQLLTGQSAYWYTSGGAQDRGKPTLPLTVFYSSLLDDAGAGEAPGGVGVATPSAKKVPPRNPGGPVRISANAESTSIDSIETLRQLIEDGVVTEVSAKKAGIPAKVAAGEYLRFSLPWDGDDTKGVIWLYPDVSYAGTFRVEDGVVHVTLDSSAVKTEGDQYAVFFGDAGTTVAVPFAVEGRVAAAAALFQAEATGGAPTAGPMLPIGDSRAALLWLLLLGGGGLLVLAGAGAGAVLLIRHRAVAVG